MKPKVPRGAAVLLDYIAGLETARKGDARYQTVIAHLNEKGELAKPITDMKLDELLTEQLRWVRSLKQASGAAGAYQIIRPTLQGLIKQYSVPLEARFTPDLQDAFGLALLQRRGFDKFMAGTLGLKDFGNELAKEWASLPLLSPVKRKVKGVTRTIPRGASYYDGDGINKSLDGAMDFESVLSEALNERDRQPAPVEQPEAPAFPMKGAMDNEVVAQVQRRLKELGYTEIGHIDGDFGDFTENAILIFRKDNGLPMSGAIDEDLIVALAKGQPRTLPSARQEASPEDVRQKVPEAKANWFTKVAGLWGMIAAGATGFVNWSVDSMSDIREGAQPVLDLFGIVPWWGYLALFFGVALWLYLNGRRGEAASVEAVQEGARR